MRIVMRALLALGLVSGAAVMAGCDREGTTVEKKEVTVKKENGAKREVTVETKNGDVDRAVDKAGKATEKALDKAEDATQRGLDKADKAVKEGDRKVEVEVRE